MFKNLLIGFLVCLSSIAFAGGYDETPVGVSAPINLNDDTALNFGTGNPMSCLWETADANANAWLCAGPEGGAVDVPGFIFGDASVLNADLGFFNGITSPFVAAISADALSYFYFGHNQTNPIFRTNEGSFDFNALHQWSTGQAITATNYQCGRNTDATNRYQCNVPTGASMEWSVNDVQIAALNVTAFWNNIYGNNIDTANAKIQLLTTGAILNRNVADANIVTIIDNVAAGATGDTLELRNASAAVTSFPKTGGMVFDAGAAAVAANYEVRRNADATNRMQYNCATGCTHEVSINDTAETTLNATNFSPGANDGNALGVSGTAWADLFLATGALIDFAAADVTMTHAANALAFAGASDGYTFDAGVGVSTSGASAQDPLSVTYANTAYSNSKGLIGVRRTGAITGVATESMMDLNQNPSFTLTDPTAGGGAFSYYGVNIDQSSVAVTAGVGSSTVVALHLVANADADAETKYSLWADTGLARVDEGLDLDGDGVKITEDSDGAITFLGMGNGSDEDLTLNLDDTADTVSVTSSTGVTNTDFGTIDLKTDALNLGEDDLTVYDEGTCTPTVTLVGGVGNAVPVYLTNTCRFTRTGRTVDVDIYLTGDGGAEGAGTGQVNVALPFTASASHPASSWPVGTATNGATEYILTGSIGGSATVITIRYFNAISTTTDFTGADQNNVSRAVRLKFTYEI